MSRYIIILTFLFYVNAQLSTSPLCLIITLLQYLYVIRLLIRKKYEDAILWHFLFMITSYSRLDYVRADIDMLYNYFSVKLIGPVTFSYLFTIYIWGSTKKHTILNYIKPSFCLSKMQHYFRWFFLSGVFLGMLGLLFMGYFFDAFIEYTVYIFIILLHLEILIKYNSSKLQEKVSEILMPLLTSSVLANVLNFYAGITIIYGAYETTLANSVAIFVVLMILQINKIKQNWGTIIVIILYMFITTQIGASGKLFFNIGLIALIYLLRELYKNGIGFKTVVALCVVIVGIFYTLGLEGNVVFNSKLNEFKSMSNVFQGDVESVSESPYIRIASMMNIYLENIQNPLKGLLGRGFGGYFVDQLNMFAGFDLSHGAFSDEYIKKGMFPSAHSTFAIVPLLHGFLGIYFIIKLVICYSKRSITENSWGAAALIWLLFSFYYNILIGIAGVFILYSSEYCIQNKR